MTNIERVEDRSDIEEGRTYMFSDLKKSVICFLTEGDWVKAKDLTNQQGPEGRPLKVVENYLEEVTVETADGERYTLTGIHYTNLDGPFSWLRTPEGESRGQVEELEVICLEGADNDEA